MARKRRSKPPLYEADHPSNVELAMVAAGRLDTAKADVIATHVCGCASCRTFVRAMEHVGGVVLNSLPPTPFADRSLAGVMARLDSAHDQVGSANLASSTFNVLVARK